MRAIQQVNGIAVERPCSSRNEADRLLSVFIRSYPFRQESHVSAPIPTSPACQAAPHRSLGRLRRQPCELAGEAGGHVGKHVG
jgi:hypothetical protein